MSDPRSADTPIAVVVLPGPGDLHAAEHDRVTRDAQAGRIAHLLNLPFADTGAITGPVFVVPSDTLSLDQARTFGVVDASRIYGGVAPHAFVATKAVTHGLLHADATAPEGWNPRLAEALHDCVLAGWTAFSLEEAREAGLRLLESGPVRIKDVRATAGQGQTVVRTSAELGAALAVRDPDEIARHGVVLEENLVEPETLSVGTTWIGEHRIAYWGVQRFTETPTGEVVYGGSDLQVSQGDYEDLLAFPLPDRARTAIALARAYEDAVFAAYPSLLASRRNYDVILGRNADGRSRAGVLEQSWRIGGASGAEIAAIEAFQRDRSQRLVRSETMEIRSADAPVPEGAALYYRGVDPDAGPLTKYARVLT